MPSPHGAPFGDITGDPGAGVVPQADPPAGRPPHQLAWPGLMAVWAAAALPMAFAAWVVAPWLADRSGWSAGLPGALIVTLTAGLVWQALLTLALVVREQRTWRWGVLCDALWLRAPRSPRTGRRGGRAWWVVAPFVVAFALESALPSLPFPADHDLGTFLGSDAGRSLLDGSWGWFALIALMLVANTVVGEELLFRGYLLPRSAGVFGRRAWLGNGVMFALYHLHMPWAIPAALLDAFVLAWPSQRWRSALVGIAVHSAQSVVILGMVLAVVLGAG
ncbi:CAAX prenyl protease-like protein [Luteimicrobium subarcticum]|uniref:CAAX prenyl protease-like protein n=1 Tax=Luteimicrobium subarcticum TaxID=620910 RepID=A0A2M8WRB7_9MICO|nr:CAAX prenyl protease-like protein [Luteimicrobium subarcticum]